VQVDPIKLTLKASGKLLTLKYDDVLSSFAFDFNLRRYNKAAISLALKAKWQDPDYKLNQKVGLRNPKPETLHPKP